MGCPAADQAASGVEAGLIATPRFLQCMEDVGVLSAGQEGKRNLSEHPAAMLSTMPPDGGLPVEQLRGLPGRWPSRIGLALVYQ